MRYVLGNSPPHNSAYDTLERSVEDGAPIELYHFTWGDNEYNFTSSQYEQIATYEGKKMTFEPEYIRRGDSLKLGDSSGTVETCIITVPRSNAVSVLYQGAPPENDSVRLQLFRYHDEKNATLIKICDGIVSQIRWQGSYSEITITIENVMNRYIPRCSLSYWCQNVIYDHNCGLKLEDYEKVCKIKAMSGLIIMSDDLKSDAGVEPGYYTGGFIIMGASGDRKSKRTISAHIDGLIKLKYPIHPDDELETEFRIYPSCDYDFRNCHEQFNNHANFSGIPYTPPYNVFNHKADTPWNVKSHRPSYWVNSEGQGLVTRRGQDGRLRGGDPPISSIS